MASLAPSLYPGRATTLATPVHTLGWRVAVDHRCAGVGNGGGQQTVLSFLLLLEVGSGHFHLASITEPGLDPGRP